MLQVARLAPTILGEAAELVAAFVQGCQNEDGGFPDRDGNSDLYYTVFAVDALTALRIEVPQERLVPYLRSFGDGEGLDFIHLCCLARVWSAMPTEPVDPKVLANLLERIEAFRTPEGGYDQTRESKHGTAYGCLLAYGAYADHKREPTDLDGLRQCLSNLQSDSGGWQNDTIFPIASSLATGAAVSLCRNLRHPIPEGTGNWLIGTCLHPEGGFLAFPAAPMPDLLSTAVSLHALDGLQVPLDRIKEPCLDFVDTLWTAAGGFHGTWEDDTLDQEYTYYGLLALGHLAL